MSETTFAQGFTCLSLEKVWSQIVLTVQNRKVLGFPYLWPRHFHIWNLGGKSFSYEVPQRLKWFVSRNRRTFGLKVFHKFDKIPLNYAEYIPWQGRFCSLFCSARSTRQHWDDEAFWGCPIPSTFSLTSHLALSLLLLLWFLYWCWWPPKLFHFWRTFQPSTPQNLPQCSWSFPQLFPLLAVSEF